MIVERVNEVADTGSGIFKGFVLVEIDLLLRSSKLGTLTADRYGDTGKVDFNGIVASTQFAIQGIERRWDWGLGTDGKFDYAIVISTDGTGKFYNFRGSNDGTAKPSDIFKCSRR